MQQKTNRKIKLKIKYDFISKSTYKNSNETRKNITSRNTTSINGVRLRFDSALLCGN